MISTNTYIFKKSFLSPTCFLFQQSLFVCSILWLFPLFILHNGLCRPWRSVCCSYQQTQSGLHCDLGFDCELIPSMGLAQGSFCLNCICVCCYRSPTCTGVCRLQGYWLNRGEPVSLFYPSFLHSDSRSFFFSFLEGWGRDSLETPLVSSANYGHYAVGGTF